jgi:hypothetical protein
MVQAPRKTREKGNIMSNTSDLGFGAWGGLSFTITPEAKNVFDQSVKDLRGVQYTPLAFAIQVVSGLNYCFLCEGHVVSPEMPEFAALIYVYAPLEGDHHITGITRINP